jgi:choline dehydrogenase-like flavoprotein
LMQPTTTQALVIGSGAGGAVTALELARAGIEVLLLEEGAPCPERNLSPLDAFKVLYRDRGMTPILGPCAIGFVEGRVLGGSTEVNSGFWHRSPGEILLRWQAQYDLQETDNLSKHFDWAEEQLQVGTLPGELPSSSLAFSRGAQALDWTAVQVPRIGQRAGGPPQLAGTAVARMGMSRSLLPKAVAAGVRVLTRCRVTLLLKQGRRVTGVLARLTREDGTEEVVRIQAERVFVCAGPIQTPALLRRSGILFHVGDSLRIHPMLKIAAVFPEPIHQERAPLPLLQVKEFWPEICLGGSFFSPGHVAHLLSENWPDPSPLLKQLDHMAVYYVAVRGTGKGSVRPSILGPDRSIIRYALSMEDELNLNRGLARLAALLLAAGAREVYPAVHGLPVIKSELEAIRLLDSPVGAKAMSLTTVHAFSSCPIGERTDRCAADSFGKVHFHDNLFVNDASMLPDSPGVNPQGSVMAFARRNVLHQLETWS